MTNQVQLCSICFNATIGDLCAICSDSSRDHRIVAVVERPSDVVALENTGSFEGVYHVLHGTISPVNGIGPNDLKIRELVQRVDKGEVFEVVIATNSGAEGEATGFWIQRELRPKGIKITRFAWGNSLL